jgi:hypothetical protein
VDTGVGHLGPEQWAKAAVQEPLHTQPHPGRPQPGGGGGTRQLSGPVGLVQTVPATAAQSASTAQTRRAPVGHRPVEDATQVAAFDAAPPTQHTWPFAQLVGVHGGGVQTRIAVAPVAAAPPAAAPPPAACARATQLVAAGQSAAVEQTCLLPAGHSTVPLCTQAGMPLGVSPAQQRLPCGQLLAVHGCGIQLSPAHAPRASQPASSKQAGAELEPMPASLEITASGAALAEPEPPASASAVLLAGLRVGANGAGALGAPGCTCSVPCWPGMEGAALAVSVSGWRSSTLQLRPIRAAPPNQIAAAWAPLIDMCADATRSPWLALASSRAFSRRSKRGATVDGSHGMCNSSTPCRRSRRRPSSARARPALALDRTAESFRVSET